MNWYDKETGYDQDYEDNLRRRQKEHLERVHNRGGRYQKCLHDGCPQCVGTGIKKDGSACIHCLSCSCPKCSPVCMASL